MVHWIYIIKCNDEFIYVGETINLYKRLTQHIRGRGGKNTHIHIPRKLIGLYKLNNNQSFYQYNSAIKNGGMNNIQTVIDEWGTWGDNLFIENRFTERLFYERRINHEYGTGNEWYRVRGGKYTRHSLDDNMYRAKLLCERPNRIAGGLIMTTPIDTIPEEEIVDRPLCYCGMPCEVNLSKDKTKIYFICAVKNVWNDFFKDIEVSEPCNFWKLYANLEYPLL
jgi:predicted GIY-YIG superfamily endonuclease